MIKVYLNRADLATFLQKLNEAEIYAAHYEFKEKLELLDMLIKLTGNTSIKTEVEITSSEMYRIKRGMNND